MTKEQFLTELIGECYHDPIHIITKNIHGGGKRLQIRRMYKCSKCKVILIKTDYEGLVPFKVQMAPSFTLDFESWEVFGKLLKFAQTSGINPQSPYKDFWDQFCFEVRGGMIDDIVTLPKSHISSPYVFANSLCAFLLRHPELLKVPLFPSFLEEKDR